MTNRTAGDTTGLDDLIAFVDGSPSPWHVVASSVVRLDAAGFTPLSLTDDWTAHAGGRLPSRGYVVAGASLVAFRLGVPEAAATPFRVIGAHTDSPCLRVKPRPDTGHLGWRQLGVEVYGGVLLNSWLDRDLGIAGRVVCADGSVTDVIVDEPVCRVPQLAIHLDRDVTDKGLVLDKQQHLTPIWGTGTSRDGAFREWLADRLGTGADDVAWWELCLFDRTGATVLGADRSLLASGRLDNQVSCWAAVDERSAQVTVLSAPHTR